MVAAMSESVAMIAVATRGSVVECESVVSVCSLQSRGYGHRHGADATTGRNFLVFKMQRLPGFRLNLAGCSSFCT